MFSVSGCEFFKDYKDRDYTAEGLVFNWNQVKNVLNAFRFFHFISLTWMHILEAVNSCSYSLVFWINNTVLIASISFCHQDFVDAPLTIPACFTKNLNIDWSEYQVNTCLLQWNHKRKKGNNTKVLLYNSLGATIIIHSWLVSLQHPDPFL